MTDSSTSTQQTEQDPTDTEVLDGLDAPTVTEPAGSEIPPDGQGEQPADDSATVSDSGSESGNESTGETASESIGDSTSARTDESTEADDGAEPAAPKRSRAKLLEREGEVAADFLETLLDIADLDGDIEVDIEGDRAAIAVVDSDEGRVPRRLVGPQGKVLEALQDLTRLAVQTATGERSRLMLDVAGHRAARRTALVEIAKVAIADVKATGLQKALDDMTAFERKVVHDEVAAAGLESESEGVEPHRHIVILPA